MPKTITPNQIHVYNCFQVAFATCANLQLICHLHFILALSRSSESGVGGGGGVAWKIDQEKTAPAG